MYLQWKQYDLAIQNYKASLKEVYSSSVELKLAKALFLDNKLSLSEKAYIKSSSGKLSNFEKLLVYEGLGDVFKSRKKS